MEQVDIVLGGECTVRCRGITSGGAGVCETGAGFVVFVEGVLPGETVKVRVTKLMPSRASGEIVEILTPSADRLNPKCPLFGSCGGCDFMHMTYGRELECKRQIVEDALFRIGKLSGVITEPVIGDWNAEGTDFRERYRNKGQYVYIPAESGVYRENDSGLASAFGFYRKKSHSPVAVYDCMLQQADNAGLLSIINDWADAYGIGLNDLRDVTVRTGENTGETAVILGGCSQKIDPKAADRLKRDITDAFPAVSAIVMKLREPMRGAAFIYGDGAINEVLGGCRFKVSREAFFQVNTKMAETLYTVIEELADFREGDRLWDIYCGTGSIAVYLAASVRQGGSRGTQSSRGGSDGGSRGILRSVIGIERFSGAVRDANDNARENGVTNAEFICGTAEDKLPKLIARGEPPDIIVLDPPRQGCDVRLLNSLCETGARKIIYVSCDPATLARDAARICKARYRVLAVRPVDMFARTANVECVMSFEQ